MRVQPRVDAADVEHVPAPGQAPHHLAAAHLLQAHQTRRALRRAGVKVLVRGRRRQQRADVHLSEPARLALQPAAMAAKAHASQMTTDAASTQDATISDQASAATPLKTP